MFGECDKQLFFVYERFVKTLQGIRNWMARIVSTCSDGATEGLVPEHRKTKCKRPQEEKNECIKGDMEDK